MLWRTSVCRGIAAFAAVVSLAAIVAGQGAAADEPLVVHEWGTFTSLHDEQGNAIGGINSDDEPVPDFVHRVAGNLVLRSQANFFPFAKSTPRSHPDVTMRLETPVVYFHPGRGTEKPLHVNIEVAFHSGWLSEYYPNAEVDAPGVKNNNSFGPLTAATVGRLEWNDLQIGTDASGPETTAPVWLAPRDVDAANVTATGGETEKFLFYRGVGHVDSPLRVARNDANDSLTITADFPVVEQSKEIDFVVPALWLVEIRDDKSCAFRELAGVRVPNDGKPRVVATTSAKFDDSQFHADNLSQLSTSMRAALMDDGLWADEADALLNTWKASYFESPGLRIFYLLPREWTDHVLPMKLSVDAKLVRTMVGRIEIVAPAQRRLLGQIAAGPASNAELLQQALIRCSGPSPEPADYRAYQSLGRFRNALVLDELKRRPTPDLQSFIDGYNLRGYVPMVPSPTP